MVRLVTEPTPHRDGQRLRTMDKYVRVCRDKGGREERVVEGGREVEGKGKERKRGRCYFTLGSVCGANKSDGS